jgi:hypothetical protein
LHSKIVLFELERFDVSTVKSSPTQLVRWRLVALPCLREAQKYSQGIVAIMNCRCYHCWLKPKYHK